MRAYVHAYEHRLACSTTCAQITNERANLWNESPSVQSSRWWSSRNQPLTSSYHSSARGDQLIARSRASPPVRSSVAIGHQRLRSRVIVGRRRTSSPVAHPSCHPVPSRLRQYGRADDSQRTRFNAVYLPSGSHTTRACVSSWRQLAINMYPRTKDRRRCEWSSAATRWFVGDQWCKMSTAST